MPGLTVGCTGCYGWLYGLLRISLTACSRSLQKFQIHCGSWLVKMFFLPFMFNAVHSEWMFMKEADLVFQVGRRLESLPLAVVLRSAREATRVPWHS